jgi:dipeptidyl aminopeptidase/acylaminoacyl peptidase
MFVLFNAGLNAQSEGKKSMKITEWLQAGPVEMPLPVFRGDDFELKDLLKFEPVDVGKYWPAPNAAFNWDDQKTFSWKPLRSGEDGLEIDFSIDNSVPRIVYLASYLNVDRWIKAELRVRSAHLFNIYLDGENIATKESSDKEDAKDAKHTVTLPTGKHLLMIKLLIDPENSQPAKIDAVLEIEDRFGTETISVSTSPGQVMSISRLLDGPKVAGVSISPDGELATVTIKEFQPRDGSSKSWLELRRVKDGGLLQTYRGKTALSSVNWAPQGKKFAYLEREKDGATLWIVDLETGTALDLLQNIKDFGSYTWSPQGSFFVYSVNEKPQDKKSGLQRLQSPRDRWPDFRTKSFLYKVNYPQGTRQRLTAGKLTTSLNAVSPDGSKLLFTTTVDGFSERPYTQTTLSLMKLSDFSIDTLYQGGWLGSAQWSPDGKKILMTGAPSLFGELGQNVPQGVIPNDFDTQAYLFHPATRKATPLTREFKPAIESAIWDKSGKAIYFVALEREYKQLFRYSLKTKKFEKVPTGVDVIDQFQLAENAPVAAYYGSGVSTPHKAFVIDLKKTQYRLLSDPGAEDYQNIVFGEVKRWTFVNDRGIEIEGRLYYPPSFDPAGKYPAIVYYYGGTSPVFRDFGGRYPKNLFAAQGYVVYVLQPGGATGFGQEFSALHVNDWGKLAAEDVIAGTRKFLEAHPFVDENRVGCIGASYGGFMTLTLLTKTDIFAAGISHAGISALSSYWGEGFWGYLYNAVAAAESFPWNRRDIYVDQSPLFNADKVNTPLLLLHGASDTNVPRGESDQFYVALKILGKPVEYVRVLDQAHWVLDYKKRIAWQQTIFAWFDRWLRDQPEWWNNLYPDSME